MSGQRADGVGRTGGRPSFRTGRALGPPHRPRPAGRSLGTLPGAPGRRPTRRRRTVGGRGLPQGGPGPGGGRARARWASPRTRRGPIRTSSPAVCASGPSSPWRLLHYPALVVADEPTTAQDPETQRQILGLLAHRSRGHGHDAGPGHPRPAHRPRTRRPGTGHVRGPPGRRGPGGGGVRPAPGAVHGGLAGVAAPATAHRRQAPLRGTRGRRDQPRRTRRGSSPRSPAPHPTPRPPARLRLRPPLPPRGRTRCRDGAHPSRRPTTAARSPATAGTNSPTTPPSCSWSPHEP